MQAFYFLLLAASFYVLIRSGSLLVKSLFQMSRFLGVGEFALAFILMAFTTSLPEFFIGITSALADKPMLSLGNVLGANIINISLALGFVTVISGGFALKSEMAKKDIRLIWLISILPIVLAADLTLSRLDGVILLVVFILYARHLLKRRMKLNAGLNGADAAAGKLFFKNIFLFILGAVILLISSWFVVFSASQIASVLELPLFLVGMFLVAFGTTLPETVFGARSIRAEHEEMALGNVLGSVAFNSTWILGLVALIDPIRINSLESFIYAAGFLILFFFYLVVLIRTRERLTIADGLLLMFFYVIFVIGEIIIKSAI